MQRERFFRLVADFEALQKQLQINTDPAERKSLLQEIHLTLTELDGLVKGSLAEIAVRRSGAPARPL